jgi:hypothetical protein
MFVWFQVYIKRGVKGTYSFGELATGGWLFEGALSLGFIDVD